MSVVSPDKLLHLDLSGEQLVFELVGRAHHLAVQCRPEKQFRVLNLEICSYCGARIVIKHNPSSVRVTRHTYNLPSSVRMRKIWENIPQNQYRFTLMMSVLEHCNIPSLSRILLTHLGITLPHSRPTAGYRHHQT